MKRIVTSCFPACMLGLYSSETWLHIFLYFKLIGVHGYCFYISMKDNNNIVYFNVLHPVGVKGVAAFMLSLLDMALFQK